MTGVRSAETVILGGGLTGLAAAVSLDREGAKDFIVLEAESVPGGLARTSRLDGYEIDILPHVFFTRDPAMDAWFQELVPDHVTCTSRRGVLVSGRYCDYPFQLNVHALPLELRIACLKDYFAAIRGARFRTRGAQAPRHFEDYLLGVFGRSMVETFFRPYNEKLWQVHLDDLDTDWVAWKIDSVDDLDMAYSFLGRPPGESEGAFGPHAVFRYPRHGGIQALPDALAHRIGPERMALETTVLRVRPRERLVETDRGTWRYRRILWTLPRSLAWRVIGTSPDSSAGLRDTEVISIHLIAEKVALPDYHWIYVADPELEFFRITRVDKINPAYQDGPAILILEVSRRPESGREPVDTVKERVLDALVHRGILTSRAAVLRVRGFATRPAYVVHDLARQRHLRLLDRRFADLDIEVAGRFGEWTFLNMDMAMQSGIEAAKRLLGRR